MPFSIESPLMTVLHSFFAPDVPLLSFFSLFDFSTFANLLFITLQDLLSSTRRLKLFGSVHSHLMPWSFTFSFEFGDLVLNLRRVSDLFCLRSFTSAIPT